MCLCVCEKGKQDIARSAWNIISEDFKEKLSNPCVDDSGIT